MLAVADVARLATATADELSRAIVKVGCARITLCPRRDIWCLVDADDYGWITKKGWNCGGHSDWKFYAKRNEGLARLTVYLHREVLIRHDPRDEKFIAAHHAHHLNGQSLDCRRANLGWRTASVNAAIRNARAACPSLESIIARLLRERVPVNEVPF